MSTKRHDDRLGRRRSRCRRLAVLGFLTLGSNLGCGQNMLRLPAGSDGALLGPAPIPYATAASANNKAPGSAPETAVAGGRKPESLAPVAIRNDASYGSSVEDLFLASYRDTNSYGPKTIKAPSSWPSHGEGLAPDSRNLASRGSRFAPSEPNKGHETQQTALFTQPQPSAPQQDREPAGSPFQATRIPPPQAPQFNPSDQPTTAVAESNKAPAAPQQEQGPEDLTSAYGSTKIPPPKRAEPTESPQVEAASQPAPIEMPRDTAASAETPSAEAPPVAAQPEPASPPLTGAEVPSLSTAPAEAEAPAELPAPAATEPSTPEPTAKDVANAPELPAETLTPAPVEAAPPNPPAAPALELSAEPAAPAPAPAAVEPPSQPAAPALELSAEPAAAPSPAPAEPPSQPATSSLELPSEAPAPVEPTSPPAAPGTAVDLLADPLALPEMPGKPATPPAEQPTTTEPEPPAASPEPPPLALPENATGQSSPPAEASATLPPLAGDAPEPAPLAKEPNGEQSDPLPPLPLEDANTPAPMPSKADPEEPTGDLSVASEETKIPLPGQASGPVKGTDLEQLPLPPLQLDPSVLEASAELPPPLPLATPAAEVAANAKCPACEILRKQKASDHWASGKANKPVSCPKCGEKEARTQAESKAGAKPENLDAALKATKISPPLLRSAKVAPDASH